MQSVVQLLLEKRADPNVQNSGRVSVAQVAAKFMTNEPYQLEMFKMLISSDNPVVLNLEALDAHDRTTNIMPFLGNNLNVPKPDIIPLLREENKKRKSKTA
jgi:hypothetical protein